MRKSLRILTIATIIGSSVFWSHNPLYAQTANDTLRAARYRVSRTSAQDSEDLNRNSTADLRNPENLTQQAEYEESSNTYRIGTKLGDSYLDVPMLMTPEEYNKWSMNKSMQSYFRQKNETEYQSAGKDKFDFTDMHFDLGPAEKIFGPGGVRIRTNGAASVKIGFDGNIIDNPSLSVQNRKTFGFDFDEQININVNATVGDKINMDLNYNTEATFNFDTKNIRLRYEGKEDEIIKLFEAGNISFPSNSSLISGATSLFGIRADFQFGKLSLQTVVSQKNSSSTTVSSQGGEQLTDFEIDASSYDENRHFFLAHYFRDNYDRNMSMLPSVVSGVNITRIEVWVTNKKSSYDSPRNILAFTDIAEAEHLTNRQWFKYGEPEPDNNSNTLYRTIVEQYRPARYADSAEIVLSPIMKGGIEYEKISNARMLDPSEYILNRTLGYISLKTTLRPDEVLAVAYEFTYGSRTYQVGEFSSDIPDSRQSLYLKLLKSSSNTPSSGTWDLMMKNIYYVGGGNITQKNFKMKIIYASDSVGSRITYLPEESLKQQTLLQIMNLDRLDDKLSPHSNGQFDYVEGYTVISSSGRIIFPVAEPFGSHLRSVIKDKDIADKYVFQELYDTTMTAAKRIADKDKFFLQGQYSGSSGNLIELGSYNIPRGSVTVSAGGETLVENVDYIVDYSLGTVTIINQNIIDAGTNVSVSLESNTNYSMQRKTMLGMNWKYDFNKNLQIGGTVMHLNEKPLTSKVTMGDEPLVNTMLGFNINWRKESQALTNLFDLLPFVNATEPSMITFNAEYARLFSDVSDEVQGSASYIDDFEAAESGIDISNPRSWSLSSRPPTITGQATGIGSGYNRALLNWFTIDPLFTRRNSPLTPSHIKNDLEQLSNHYVREVYERELYPNKETVSGESSTLQILNLAYYPDERGPYNLNPEINSEGKLKNTKDNWGGIMRSLSVTDFETANVEYIEFWLLDPFIYNPNSSGGDFYINLGEVSEDILKDGRKFFENGLPVNGDSTKYVTTEWGRVPNTTSLIYAFDNNDAANRSKQDVGLNGLSSEEEREFPTYSIYLKSLEWLPDEIYKTFYDDPAADNYHYFRGDDYDEARMPILQRYKLYNGTEGNSPNADDTNQQYNTSARTTPDVEDINNDYTMDEYERYFPYHISLRPKDMNVGSNFIADKREVQVKLRNDKTETVTWYCFRVPIDQHDKAVGGISDFSSIRFMRMYLTGFNEEVHLRFGTLELMTSQWRNYESPISNPSTKVASLSGTMTAASVNIEENGDRHPVNYVVPPGITRVLDPSQTQLIQDNEQSMSLKVMELHAGDARGIYRKSALDLRKYERMQMFAHAEALEADIQGIENGEMSMFIRIGTDYTSNYYEYEIPLKVTPPGYYDGASDSERRKVWPDENMLDVPFGVFTAVKNKRNREANTYGSGTSIGQIYSDYDPEHPENRISIIGNPSIGNVRAIMIGVRNNALGTRSAEVWVNEFRLVGYESHGGSAAQGDLNVQVSDLATLNVNGNYSTAGFGGLEQGVAERRMDNNYKYSITTNFNAGRFLPEKAKISIPFYYSYTREKTSPRYSPFDTDLELDDVIDSYPDDHSRDSIKNITQEVHTQNNLSISGAKVNISSKKSMPYDPSNFSVSYSRATQNSQGGTTEYEKDLKWKGSLNYSYNSPIEDIRPFKLEKHKSEWYDIIRDLSIAPLPQSITFNTDLSRNYHEYQERDLSNLSGGNSVPVTFSQQFYWNRSLNLRWDIFKSLKLSITTRTQAEIEEPYGAVNKDLYPDQYELWKDSVKASLARLGKPLDYQQDFTATYQVPIDKIPLFDWTNLSATYSAQYSWNRGTTYADGSTFGNIIADRRVFNINGKLNFESLYNKSKYLSDINQRYSGKASRYESAKRESDLKKKYDREVTLLPGETIEVTHNLNTLTPLITTVTQDGTPYKLKYKVKDANTITINTTDSVALRMTVRHNPKRSNNTEKATIKDVGEFSVRFLMLLRNISVTYKNDYSMSLPGFMPGIGKVFGQQNLAAGMAPGLDFAFGFIDDSYLQKAHDRGWLLDNDSVAYNATTNSARDIQIKMTLEPVSGLKIDLNASWTMSDAKRIQYMYAGMPQTRTGTFNMTTISIGSAFESRNASDEYYSATFERFRNNLDIVQSRLEQRYRDSRYPQQSTRPGQPYDPANGGVGKYSTEVMVPAFLATYSGKDASTSSLDLFPSIFSILPNWSVTYNGLAKIDFFKNNFKSFNLTHAYKSVYSTGTYNTYSTYMEYMDGIGFIQDISTGNPIPSSMYDISSVSINESFSPLVGVNMTMNNGVTAKVEIRKTRVMNLSMAAIQMSETTSDDIVVGAGYKIVNLKMLGAHPGSGKNKVSNDLNMNCDISYRNQSAICRNIANTSTQATSGNKAVKVALSADYTYSKFLTLNFYYNFQSNFPLVSTSSFPTSTHDCGFTIKFSLTR
ncbi:MAG: cell surface protein SprA [Bacteroidaceae bacterium]|nr:cell surface protein SprA [Bacteroidaceae bacterium]